MASTTFADEQPVIASIEAGAAGYLLKAVSAEKIADEIRALHGGGLISPWIAGQALEATSPASPLSPRERQTPKPITKGFSHDELAELMRVSRNTVMAFVRRIYRKLGACSKAEAI